MTSDLGHWNIDAKVFKDRVEEIHFVSDPARNIRRHQQKHVWHVGKFLGRGGFGEVRVQHNHESGKSRAVKRIITTDQELSRAECEKELKALLEFSKPKFKEAACFVEFYGWFIDGPEIFLAMEFLQHGDLESNVVARSGKLPELEAREIAAQILSGLVIMHAADFAHRDIKPQNVLVVSGPPESQWWVKLADFGLSKRLTETTALHTRSGTRFYMAPEMLSLSTDNTGSNYTNAVDLWATGCIIYRLITGATPFASEVALGSYCKDRSLFPLDQLYENGMRNVGYRFLQDLLAASPLERATASRALEHEWIKIGLNAEGRLDSAASNPGLVNTSLSKSTDLSLEYATVSHDGLKSELESALVPDSHHSGSFSFSGTSPSHAQLLDPRSQMTTIRPSPTRQPERKPAVATQGFNKNVIAIGSKTLEETTGLGGYPEGSVRERSVAEYPQNPVPRQKDQMTTTRTRTARQTEQKPAMPAESANERRIPIASSETEQNRGLGSSQDGPIQERSTAKDPQNPVPRPKDLIHVKSKYQSNKVGRFLGKLGLQTDLDRNLRSACEGGDLSAVRQCIENGADANTRDSEWGTPLCIASRYGSLAIVQLLVDNGADINVTTDHGRTPLHQASIRGYQSIVEVLLDAGAEVDATYIDSQTSLHLASKIGSQSVVEVLLKAGTAVNAIDKELQTPLHLASKVGNQSIVEVLLNAGAAIDAIDNEGRTPLHEASECGHQSIVEILLNAGAAADAIDTRGEKPLYRAIHLGHWSTAQLLLDRGANMESLTDKSLISLAEAGVHEDRIKKVLEERAARSRRRR